MVDDKTALHHPLRNTINRAKNKQTKWNLPFIQFKQALIK